MDSNLLFERDGAVGLLTLNRPERLNALDHDLVRALHGFFDERRRDYGCRVIVITGAGRGFCAGLDLKARETRGTWQPGAGPVQDMYTFQSDLAELVTKMRRCPQPLIAAVNGPAAGGGLSIALACDLRVAVPTARFACSFVNLGISGCDVGSSYHLPKLVGASRAADMIYSGRLVDAAEAREWGLANEVVEPEQLLVRTKAIATEFVRRSSPLGLRMSKEVLNETVTGISMEAALKLENRTQPLCGQTEDAREASAAWLEKRDPVWKDR